MFWLYYMRQKTGLAYSGATLLTPIGHVSRFPVAFIVSMHYLVVEILVRSDFVDPEFIYRAEFYDTYSRRALPGE